MKGKMNKKYHVKGLVKKVGKDAGFIQEAIISSEVVDRTDEVIKQQGIDLENFKKNPVLLWAHNASFSESRPPIGKVVRTWIENKSLKFSAQFDLEDDFAKMIYNKYKKGFLNAFSIGFQPQEKDGNVYTKVEALEFSAVPVPANPEALVELRGMTLEPKTWDQMFKKDKQIKKKVKKIKKKEVKKVVKKKAKKLNKPKKVVKTEEVTVDFLQDNMRILYTVLGVALKKIKEQKRGGE